MGIGDKVICVNDSHENEFKGLVFQEWITKGKEYTIREIFDNDGITPSVLLEGVSNIPVPIPVLNIVREPSFRIERFEVTMSKKMQKEKVLEILNEILNVI
jgi:hypothetical protein